MATPQLCWRRRSFVGDVAAFWGDGDRGWSGGRGRADEQVATIRAASVSPWQSGYRDGRRWIHIGLDFLRTALGVVDPSVASAVQAVEERSPTQRRAARNFFEELLREIDARKPDDPSSDDSLVDALERTVDVVAGFWSVAEVIAAYKPAEVVEETLRGFEQILLRYASHAQDRSLCIAIAVDSAAAYHRPKL